MLKRLLLIAPLAAGIGAGTSGLVSLLAAPHGTAQAPMDVGDGKFVTLGTLLVPVTLADGQLTAYASVEAQLEIKADDVPAVEARLPLIIHGVNVRTFATPLASGPDGRVPHAAKIRTIVADEAGKVLGQGTVRSVALTKLVPA